MTPATIIGGIVLLIIAFALIKRGMKLVGTVLSIAILLVIAYVILVAMGIVPDPRV